MLRRNPYRINTFSVWVLVLGLVLAASNSVSAGKPAGRLDPGRSQARLRPTVSKVQVAARLRRAPGKPARPPLVSADEAMKLVRTGQRVLLPAEVGASQVLVDALARRAASLKGKKPIEVVHPASLLEPTHVTGGQGKLEVNALFINGSIRPHLGKFRITPTYLGEIPRLVQGPLKPNVVFIRVSPPDKRGFVSMGPNADVVSELLADRQVKVIAEVNSNVPRTRGDSRLHISHIDRLVQASTPLAEYSFDKLDKVAAAIGANVAREIPNGASCQFGIGDLQEAVANKLVSRGKKLGQQGKPYKLKVWTEIGSNGIEKLAKAGLIAQSRDAIQMGFALGKRSFYDFLGSDKRVKLVATQVINDPMIAGARRKLMAINSGVAVDLYGQACSEMIPRQGPDGQVVPIPYSGVGGQVDFFRAARRSKGGKGFLTLRSTAKGGALSTITLDLPQGLVTTTNRYDIDRVVTEWGVAKLKDKDVVKRAQALVKVAHPKFRTQLAEQGMARFGGEAKAWQRAAAVSQAEAQLAAELAADTL